MNASAGAISSAISACSIRRIGRSPSAGPERSPPRRLARVELQHEQEVGAERGDGAAEGADVLDQLVAGDDRAPETGWVA